MIFPRCFSSFSFALVFCGIFVSCYRAPEMTLEEIEAARASASNVYIEKSISKPWKNQEWKTGKPGGVWKDSITGEPKSFNLLIAERDASTTAILEPMHVWLTDYNPVTKEWYPLAASSRIQINEKEGTLDLFYTLRDDLYWNFYEDRHPAVKVTSDDVVFWYDEIYCDQEMGSSGYNAQFMVMPDGSQGRITIEKIDDLNFVFHFPRIVAEPLLATNMNFGPRFIYEKAKKEGGAKAVKDLFSVATDPKEIPSAGKYFLVEYSPSQRLVYERNPAYWEKDENGESIAYPQTKLVKIVGDGNTEFLLFKQKELESFGPSPEQLEDVINGASQDPDSYTVYNSAGSLSAAFWTFNQNPINKDKPWYEWFCDVSFRQAMSCLLNRERIISQTYRGLAEPKYSFFPEGNAFYNEDIILQYRYSHQHAKKLLEKAGFVRGQDGFLYDDRGIKVEFDLTINGSSPVYSDIAQIIVDECKEEGITINVRQTDFQRMVEQLMSTYDWQALLIGLSGANLFPTQGSNVWVSDGNLHMWYPLQKEPATDWEARIDYLYHEASCIPDVEKARPYWEEYQQILLEQCPVIYLVRPRSFFALRNRWDMSNVYFDNLMGAETTHVFLAE